MMLANDKRRSRGANMDVRLRSALILSTITAIIVGLGCTNERGFEPSPVSYRLYVGFRANQSNLSAIIITYDADPDTIVDTIKGGLSSEVQLIVSPDGKTLATFLDGGVPLIWDLSTKTQLGYLRTSAYRTVFLPDTNLILGPGNDSIIVYNASTLEPVDIWRQQILLACHIPGTRRIVGINEYDLGSGVTPDRLVVYDYGTGQLVDSMLGYETEFKGSSLYEVCVSPDGNRVYAVGGSALDGSPAIIGWDVQQRQLLFHTKLVNLNGSCRVSPDGSEVWVTDHGSLLSVPPFWPARVMIFDAYDGTFIDSVSTAGLDPDHPDKLFYVDRIRFHPTMAKAYISATTNLLVPGFVLVIDTKSHDIVNIIRNESGRSVDWIEFAPTP